MAPTKAFPGILIDNLINAIEDIFMGGGRLTIKVNSREDEGYRRCIVTMCQVSEQSIHTGARDWLKPSQFELLKPGDALEAYVALNILGVE